MIHWKLSLLALVLGAALDALLGDPHSFPHPVRWMGRSIAAGERLLRRFFPKTPQGERLAGSVLVLGICALYGGGAWALLAVAGRVSPWLRLVLETLLCYQMLAMRCLRDESMAVYTPVKEGRLDDARKAVSMIVGRDTQSLSLEGVTKAAVETVAENASDGVIAPMFYLALGGAPLGVLYKAINTMDSMIAYKNERYLHFGCTAARLDDLANWLPARLAGGMMVLAAFICGMDGKGAWRVFRRDRRKHASPNSAHTEAACAGALQVQLAGDASYFGKIHHKPTLGDAIRPVEAEDIPRANRLMITTSVLFLILCMIAKLATILLLFK